MMGIVGMAALLAAVSAQAVLIADFDKGSKPNNVGGDFGAWDKDTSDKTQYAREGFDNVNTRTGSGYSMRVTYDVDSPSAAYNGFWMKLDSVDGSKLKNLVFWAKGDERKGCTSRIKVELKTASERGAFYIDGVNASWTKFQIPLESFNVSDLTALDEIVFVFEDHTSSPKEGILYLDDIAIE
jgi:hypothetical protein